MALSENKVVVQNFTGGLLTDFHEMNIPQVPGGGFTVDELNCDLNRKGYRQRRLGMWYETGYIQNPNTSVSVATMSTNYIGKYDWNDVNNNANLNFLVVQVGNMLNFYDKSYNPLSGGLQSFTVNLDTYKAPSAVSTNDTGLSVASGNGFLFVTGAKVSPFYIQYNAGGSITVVPINIQIRDLAEQDTALANDARLASITDARKYDLYNQGWHQGHMSCYYDSVGPYIHIGVSGNQNITVDQYYLQTEKVWPPKTAPWWVGKRIGDKGVEVFDPVQYDTVVAGNTLSALGHFIVNAFAKDRATASGIPSMGVEVTDSRPTAIAFYSGRVFYALGNTIYFSQVFTDDISAVGKCYQEADPTAEQISDLIATDGGTIMIPQSSTPLAFFQVENSLLLFTTNGLWLISGESINSGFSATNFSVTRISDIPCVSTRTIINVEGMPLWWAPQGIYTIEPISTKQGFGVKNITMKKIQNLYDSITPLAKQNATGAYDHIRKRCIWAYQGSGTASSSSNRFYYNNILILDLLFDAFIPYTVSDLPVSQPSKIVDVFNIQPIFLSSGTDTVVDNGGVTVTDAGANAVTVSRSTFTNTSTVLSDVKYLVVGPTPILSQTTVPMSFSFGDFTGTDFHDWTNAGIAGIDFPSYLNAAYTIPGYMTPHFQPSYDAMMWMYSPYVYAFLEATSLNTPPPTIKTGTLPVTVPSIMAYVGGGTIGNYATGTAIPDYQNGFVYLYKDGTTGSNNGISKFDATTTGSELLAKTIDNIGGVSWFEDGSGNAITLSNDGHLTFIGSALTNSVTLADITTDTLSFNQSTSFPLPYSLQAVSYGNCGAKGTLVTTQLFGVSEIDFIPNSVYNSSVPIRVVDERIGTIGSGPQFSDHSVSYVLGKASAAQYGSNTNTADLGLYSVTYSASGVSSVKIGTVPIHNIDATWTHWANVQGLAFDSTDGNVIIHCLTADAVSQQAYIVKLSTTNAAVLWKCPVNAIDVSGDNNMPRHRIMNSTYFHLGSSRTLYTINTATGVATTQILGDVTLVGGQVSDDYTNSIMFYGSWTENTTHPVYLGAYMGTGGHHTISNQWMRWFVGTVPGQTRNVPAAPPNTDIGKAGCLMQTAWDWSSSAASHKWSQQVDVYRPRANFSVATSKNKVRGKGKVLQLRFTNNGCRDFQLLGWGIWYAKNQHP